MKKIMTLFGIMAIFAILLTGCGEDTKTAAREAAKSTGKLVGAMATDAVSATLDIATEVASGAGEVVAEKGGEMVDSAKKKAVEMAKDTKDAIVQHARDSPDMLAKTMKSTTSEIRKSADEKLTRRR